MSFHEKAGYSSSAGPEQSIPERFEQQVLWYPDRLAVKTRSQQLTYQELNHTANRIAHAILEQAGDNQAPVGILIEQGASQIAAILGVQKASPNSSCQSTAKW